MGHYLVTFRKAHEEPRLIATAANFAEAVAAARKAGAVHEGEQVLTVNRSRGDSPVP